MTAKGTSETVAKITHQAVGGQEEAFEMGKKDPGVAISR